MHGRERSRLTCVHLDVPAYLHDFKLPLDFIVIGIHQKLLLKRAHFHLKLCFFSFFPLRAVFVMSCELRLRNGQLRLG